MKPIQTLIITVLAATLVVLTSAARAQNGFFAIHSFGVSNTSYYPYAGVAISGNVVYGTTEGSGGRVWKCNTDGTGFTNIYTFGGNANPVAGVVLGGSTLYGATENPGIIFAIGNTPGTGLTNLWSFGNGGGQNPRCTPILAGNTLYGTTGDGDNIYSVAIDGSNFTNLYSFSPLTYNPVTRLYTNGDGALSASSYGSLALSANLLYGVAPAGGLNNNGTVYKFNLQNNQFTTLYNFSLLKGNTNADGGTPIGSLAVSGGVLYGTTSAGGTNGNGTIFSINTDGTSFSVLHTFSAVGGSQFTNFDGTEPIGGLILSGGTLYGTAAYGGTGGSGTVFKINTDGSGFTTLYNFTPQTGGVNSDGANPNAALTLSSNLLYGTALSGGTANGGTVFALSIFAPPVPLSIHSANGSYILTWNNSSLTLQASPDLTLGFTNVTGATSPYTNNFTGPQTFFRLSSN